MFTYLEGYACGHRRHRPRLTHPQIFHLIKHPPLHSRQHNRQTHDQVKENTPPKSTPARRIALVDVPHRQQQSHQMTCQGRRQDAALHPPAQPTQQSIKTPTCTTNPTTHQKPHLHNQPTNSSKHCQTNKHIKQENNALNLIIFFKGVHWHTLHSKQNKLQKKKGKRTQS